MIKVSVILTVYNNSSYLQSCLNSIFEQSFLPEEIIIIDDGSKDNLAEKIYKKNYKKLINLKFYKIKNRGSSGARNFGLNKVNCDYFCFFDPDDTMSRNFIRDKIKIFQNCEINNLVGVYSNIELVNNLEVKSFKYKKGLSKIGDIDSIGKKDGLSGSLPTFLFNKSLIDKHKFILDKKIQINEDFDFIIRLVKKGLKIYGINKKQTYVNLYKKSLTRSDENQNFVYLHQKKFIKKAEKLNYFTDNELIQRKKYIELRMAKFKLQNFYFKSFIYHILKYLKL